MKKDAKHESQITLEMSQKENKTFLKPVCWRDYQ